MDKINRVNRVNDNFNLEFPAIMNDGRQFTDYRSNCVLNNLSQQMSSQEYKNYLINNTNQILKNQMEITRALMDCKNCGDYSIIPSNLSLQCNKNNCTNFVNNPNFGRNVDRTIKDFEAILRFIEKDHAFAHYGLAKAYKEKNDYKMVEQHLQSIKRIISKTNNKWKDNFEKLITKENLKQLNDFVSANFQKDIIKDSSKNTHLNI